MLFQITVHVWKIFIFFEKILVFLVFFDGILVLLRDFAITGWFSGSIYFPHLHIEMLGDDILTLSSIGIILFIIS